MRNYAHIIGLATLLAALTVPLPASAGKIPNRLAYRFYVNGQEAGRSEITFRQEPGKILTETRTRVTLTGEVVEYTSRAVADATTFAILSYTITGTQAGQPVACSLNVHPDSIQGWTSRDHSRVERRRKGRAVQAFLFEDWMMDIQVLLALRQDKAPPVGGKYRLTFALSFLPAEMVAAYTGDTLVQSSTRSVVARKLDVAIAGNEAFQSQVSPETGLPLYILFPSVRTEAFNEDFFGEKYPTRFITTAKPTPAGPVTNRPAGH